MLNIHLSLSTLSRFLHILSPTEFPRIGRFYLLFSQYKKKSVGILPVASLITRGFSHCPTIRDGQRRSPRIGIKNLRVNMLHKYAQHATAGYNIPTVDIHRCLCLVIVFCNFARITSNQRQSVW